jgi:hypothetical protein
MNSIVDMISTAALSEKAEASHLGKLISYQNAMITIGRFLQQAVEKLDRLRATALTCLRHILLVEPFLNYLHLVIDPIMTQNLQIIQSTLHSLPDGSLEKASDTFPVCSCFLQLSFWRPYVITGWITSAGGLGESIVRCSQQSLTHWLRKNPVSMCRGFVEDLLGLFKHPSFPKRLLLPWLKTIEMVLIHHRILFRLLDEDPSALR